MKIKRRTRKIDWIVCGVFLLLGVVFLMSEIYAREHGTTPKEELVYATGPVTITDSHWIKVGDYTAEYTEDLRNNRRLREAITARTPVTIGISTNQETFFPRKGWVPLYSLTIGGETLVSYEDTLKHGYRSRQSWVVAAALLALGVWGLWTCWRNRAAISSTPQEIAEALSEPRRILTTAILFSALIYAAVIGAMMDEECLAVSAKVFGPNPLGMNLRLFVVLFFTVLLVPLPFGAWHGFRLVFYDVARGRRVKSTGVVTLMLWEEEMRRSKRIAVAIVLFYLGLMIGWIVWADAHGI